jgi:hypothetical protein
LIVTGLDEGDTALVKPLTFVAVTVKVYTASSVRPLNVQVRTVVTQGAGTNPEEAAVTV